MSRIPENYRPDNVQFTVAHDDSPMPLDFGKHDTLEEAMKVIHKNLTVVNEPLTTNRHMDFAEKGWIREDYCEVLEDDIPRLDRELSEANKTLADAKKKAKEAEERYNASISKSLILAKQVKEGKVPMNLDDIATFRVPYKGKYYFYTYMDQVVKLCHIHEIPDHEKTDLYNVMAGNEIFIDEQYGKTEPQEGQEE